MGPDHLGWTGPRHAARDRGREGESVSKYDEKAAGESLRKAVEQLSGDGVGDGAQAAQAAVQALHGQEWTPGQETQIQAMVGQIRKVRDLSRPGGGGWRRRRAWRAQGRLDLMMTGGPELVNEAELRHWKNQMTVQVLLEFMRQRDEAGRHHEGAHPDGGAARRDLGGLAAGQEGAG